MFHSVELRATCHATEDEGSVERAMRALSPGAVLERQVAEGHHGNPIVLLSAELRAKDAIEEFWKRLREAGVVARILSDLDARIDDEAVLHLRVDKQRAFDGSLELASHDDVIAVRAKVAAHPAKRSTAVRVARAYLSGV